MPEQYTYSVLKKKLDKVNALMEKLLLKDQGNSKEYRAFEKKKREYQAKIEKTTEYKEAKLQNALDSLHASIGSIDLSIDQDDHSESDSSSSSSSSSSSEDSVDYPLVLKKYDKVGRILKELEADHGVDEAKERKDYKKYLIKQNEYLGELKKTKEWAEESYRRAKKEALAKAKARAEKEQEEALSQQEQAVAAAKEAQKEELEAEKKRVLAKLREDRAKKEEQKRAKEEAYRQAQLATQRLMEKEMQG